MKKHFLLVALFMVVFLGLGNHVFGQDWWVTDNSNAPTPPTQSEPPTVYPNQTQDPIDNLQGQGVLIDSSSNTKCTNYSVLKDRSHSKNSVSGFGCECEPNYGEYYNVNTKETTCELCSRDDVCCGVKLNTAVPFIGNCIETKTDNTESTLTEETAFPVLMSSLTKILVTVILIVSFVLIVVGGIMIASAGANPSNASAGKKLIMKVVIGIALLGASGVILRLINPNFFG